MRRTPLHNPVLARRWSPQRASSPSWCFAQATLTLRTLTGVGDSVELGVSATKRRQWGLVNPAGVGGPVTAGVHLRSLLRPPCHVADPTKLGSPSPLLSSTRPPTSSAPTKHPSPEPRIADQERGASLRMIPRNRAPAVSPVQPGHHLSCYEAMECHGEELRS